MSRSGYSEDIESWDLVRWRGAVASAIRGARGQAFLKEMLVALDALTEKKLVKGDLEKSGEVCAIGAVGKRRGVDMTDIDPEDREKVSDVFWIAPALAAEIVHVNDDGVWLPYHEEEAPEARFVRVRAWVESQIDKDDA